MALVVVPPLLMLSFLKLTFLIRIKDTYLHIGFIFTITGETPTKI